MFIVKVVSKKLPQEKSNHKVVVEIRMSQSEESNSVTVSNHTVLVTPYWPDIVICNRLTSLMGIIELTCPLGSLQHLESARSYQETI